MLVLDALPETSGIYIIVYDEKNTLYVGQTSNSCGIRRRIQQHINLLKRNKHPAKHMQHVYNKYGLDVFSAHVAYECEDSDLNRAEQEFLDMLRMELPEFAYFNMCMTAGSSRGVKMSEESKLKMSRAKLGKPGTNKGKRFSKEHRKKLSVARKQRITTEETKKKIASGVCKEWNVSLVDPMGNIHVLVSNLNQFCKDHNLDQSCMNRLIKGESKQHKGWTLLEDELLDLEKVGLHNGDS